MDREKLVEAMAEALYARTRSTSTPWAQLHARFKRRWAHQARAALAVAEPVVRAYEREDCIAIINLRCGASAEYTIERLRSETLHVARSRTGGTP